MLTYLSIFSEPSIILLAIICIVILATIGLLKRFEKRIEQELYEKIQQENKFQREINLIINSSSPLDAKLSSLDTLAREFLHEKLHLDQGFDYTQAAEDSRQKGKLMIFDFCQKMAEAMYSGETFTPGKELELAKKLKNIIEGEQRLTARTEMRKIPLGKRIVLSITKVFSDKAHPEVFTNSALPSIVPQKEAPKDNLPQDKIHSLDNLERIKKKMQNSKMHSHLK